MPYQPFSKSDRLGKVSDWTGVIYTDKRFMNKYTPQFGANSNQFAYFHEDEENFQLVDTVRVQKPPYQRGRNRFNQNKLRREREKKIQLQNNLQVLSKVQKSRERDRQRQLRKWQKQFGRQQQDRWKERNNVRPRESTVIVRDSWTVLEEIDFPRLTKLKLSSVKEPQDLYTCGNLSFYDRQYDRVSTKNEKPLRRIDRVFHNVPTVLDPIIRKLRKEGNVFATDDVLATLMSCTRSIYPWDIIVNIVSNKIFLDKRENSNINTLSVSETATEPPQDDDNTLNDPRKLALEARFINNNFTQQVLLSNDKTQDLEFENPFQENQNVERVASVGYRYRKWDLGNDNILVARTEHDAVTYAPNGELLYINIKALNEWDYKQSGGIDWRSKIDNQRGAVLATELKNNNSKLAKWTICSLLSGSSQIKFGYVSRRQVNDSTKHVILGMQQFKPTEFAQQINLNMDNAWAILRCIIDMCKKLKQGKYLIMKDPNKPMIRIYDIPDKTFDNSDSEDDSETTNSEDDD